MKENNRKAANIIFIAFFMLALIIPVCFMNFKENQVSDIDNKLLTEWPDLSADKIDSEIISDIESYVNDRIGFRSDAIKLYTEACDKVFGLLVHPIFMYGKDGHIYYSADHYISAYQRININKEGIEAFIDFIKKTDEYCKSKNIQFIFYMCTDKKTIYPEYFPASINVNEKNESTIEITRNMLEKKGIEYIIPYDELMEQKKTELIYNKKYDVAHWNELASFTAHSLLDEKIRSRFNDIPPLSTDSYDLEYVTEKKLPQSDIIINDSVPVYSLKNDTSGNMTDYLTNDLKIFDRSFYSHYTNPEVNNNRRLLIFTDSYFGPYAKYYNNRYKEVYLIHRMNYQYLQYYVNLLFPDVVVFEVAERCVPSDLTYPQLYGNFIGYTYEKPYDFTGAYSYEDTHDDLSDDPTLESFVPYIDGDPAELDLSYTIYSVSGAEVDNDKIKINPYDGESIVSIEGIMNNFECTKDLDIYLLINGNYLETDYNELHLCLDDVGSDNKQYFSYLLQKDEKKFSINIQRRYIEQTAIELIAVDRQSHTQYLIQSFDIVYDS